MFTVVGLRADHRWTARFPSISLHLARDETRLSTVDDSGTITLRDPLMLS